MLGKRAPRAAIFGKCLLVAGLTAGLLACKTTEGDLRKAEYGKSLTPAAHVEKLLEAGDVEGAAEVYEKQSAYFSKNQEIRRKAAKGIAGRLARELDPKAKKASLRLDGVSWPAERSSWPEAKAAVQEGEAVLAEASDYKVLEDAKRRPDSIKALEKKLAKLKEDMAESAGKMFAAYPHNSGTSFFDAYPAPLEAAGFLAGKSWGQSLKGLKPEQIVAVKNTYGDKLSPEMSQALAQLHYRAVLAAKGSTKDPSLPVILTAVKETRRAGFDLQRVPGQEVVVADVSRHDPRIGATVKLSTDLPGKTVRADLDKVLADPLMKNASLVLLVDIAQSSIDMEVVKQEKVESEFQSGMRSEPNPDYIAAQEKLDAEMEDYRAAAAAGAGTQGFCMGIGCLAVAVTQIGMAIYQGVQRSDVEDAQEALRATPSSIETPAYSPYAFTKSTIAASKKAIINYYLLDRKNGRLQHGSYIAGDRQSFQLASDMHHEDRYRDRHLKDLDETTDMAAFENAVLEVKLSDILSDAVSEQSRSERLDRISRVRKLLVADRRSAEKKLMAAKPKRDKLPPKSGASDASGSSRVATAGASAGAFPATGDLRLSSSVIIASSSGLGSGFFVTDDTVVTNYHVVKANREVVVGLFGGAKTTGRLIAHDVARDLAVLRVDTRGTPVDLYNGELPLGQTVEAVGHPKGLTFSVTRGVISAVRELPSRRLRGAKVRFVQTDAPINSGNSGGPLFLNGEVVGVNTWKLADVSIEGVGFALHVDEVRDFLRRHGITTRPTT